MQVSNNLSSSQAFRDFSLHLNEVVHYRSLAALFTEVAGCSIVVGNASVLCLALTGRFNPFGILAGACALTVATAAVLASSYFHHMTEFTMALAEAKAKIIDIERKDSSKTQQL